MPDYRSPGVYVEEVYVAIKAIAGVGTSTAAFIGVAPDQVTTLAPNPDFDPAKAPGRQPRPERSSRREARGGEGGEGETDGSDGPDRPFRRTVVPVAAAAGEPVLCTNFGEFKRSFGDFSVDPGHNTLVHAVFGFFNNGGSRCFVVRMQNLAQIDAALERLEAIDEVALVAAPGITDEAARSSLLTHCDRTGDRFAILDSPEEVKSLDAAMLPPRSKNGAFYFPWLRVSDPVEKLRHPDGTGSIFVPPSGHVAGIYARVDAERGVHKAPANEVVRGALDLKYPVTRAQQDGLNPHGINCIRNMNGNIRVWGARTMGGDANAEWKYVNVRRLFLFLRESIDEGTQWTVFEPNDERLWARIRRNVTAFLTVVWRDGALFGATPEQAFYVKCDAETNPPEERELGRVIIEIGVAIVRPAEFVVFRISQWPGPGPEAA